MNKFAPEVRERAVRMMVVHEGVSMDSNVGWRIHAYS